MSPESVGVGVVIPYDFALDRELWRWTPESVSLHLTRTPFEDLPVGVDQALAVGGVEVVASSTRDVLIVEPKVVAYGCTSGSFVRGRAGEQALTQAMESAGAPLAVTTSGALVSAIQALGVRSLDIVTPYDDRVGRLLCDYLGEHDVRVSSSHNMGLTERIWTVQQETTADLVRRAAEGGGDAIFASCTNLPTYDVIAELEAELGVPVLTANQVTMWAALAAVGTTAMGAGQSLLSATPPAVPGRS